MFNADDVKYLLGLEKVMVDPNQIIDLGAERSSIALISHQDISYKFSVNITLNKRIAFKTSIHHFESNAFVDLLRIDYKGRHKNPEEVIDSLPEYLKKYKGKWFDIGEPHMHIYVEGYKSLVWAIPLSDTNFPVKEINTLQNQGELIINFAKEINLISSLNIQTAIS